MKVKCPFCGYVMNIELKDAAQCNGVFIRCKGRHCKKMFELLVQNGKQLIK